MIEKPYQGILSNITHEKIFEIFIREKFLVGPVLDPDKNKIIELMESGGGIGGFVRGTAFVLGDARNSDYLQTVCQLKGDRRSKMPMGVCFNPESIIPFADLDNIPEFMHPYFKEPQLMEKAFAGFSFLRFPLNTKGIEQLPQTVYSIGVNGNYMIQNWVPDEGLKKIVQIMEEMRMVPGITSLNKMNEPEVTNQIIAAQIASENLAGFLYDPRGPYAGIMDGVYPKGSYPIIETHTILDHGIQLARAGHLSHKVMEALMRKLIHVEETYFDKNHKYPRFDIPDEILHQINKAESFPQAVRKLRAYLNSIPN
jgi:hypothetical protein